MDFLELNIHQLILSDLADGVGEATGSGPGANASTRGDLSNISAPNEDPSLLSVIDLVTSKLQTVDIREHGRANGLPASNGSPPDEQESIPEKAYMSATRLRCNIGYAELAMQLPEAHAASTVPALVDILRDITHIEYDQCLFWDEWALPDQLTYTTVAALLHLGRTRAQDRSDIVEAILTFASDIVGSLQGVNSVDILTQHAPAFHGFYRAITSTPFSWTTAEWFELAQRLRPLFATAVVERLNRLLIDILKDEDVEPDTVQFVQTFLSRYVSNGRPLTGYFTVCCVIEAQWTVLAQSVVQLKEGEIPDPDFHEAAAANIAWLSLMKGAVEAPEDLADETRDALKMAITLSMQCFTDFLVQIEDMDAEPSEDSYAWETMSESLKLSAVSCVTLKTLDQSLYSRLKLLLSDRSPISDPLVQESAMKALTVLVQNFPEISASMAVHLRRFVTSPLPIFEFEFASETHSSPMLSAAAKCLALCINLSPGDDSVLSNMYSLLNYIAATSKDVHDNSSAVYAAGISQYVGSEHHATLHSVETGLRGLSEDEKRLVGISTISVVARLALEFRMDEVTHLTISMLLQRFRSAEPSVEAAIAYHLVDLALSAPESSFVDIIRGFSALNRSSNPDDPRFSNNMVLAAQTRLAQDMHRRPEFLEVYLIELLTLFADKGVHIQNVAVQEPQMKTDDMKEQLASLILPIDALLSHDSFSPHLDASSSMISLFRNMWFLCVLFHFTAPDETHVALSWLKPALVRIADKTPSIVLEDARDSLSSDIEYNPVIRREYASSIIMKHRQLLTKYISLRSSEVRSLASGHIIFLLAMHDVESMRSASGLPSSLVAYFVNGTINKHQSLATCMDSVAEEVIRGCVSDLNGQAAEQALPDSLSKELQNLLISATHRVEKARDVALKFLNRLITSFPSLMCDSPLVFAILEVLTLMRRACENEYVDEYNPVYEFSSQRAGITLLLPDNYKVRNEVLGQLQRNANSWLELALGRAPVELQATLQKYLIVNQSISAGDSVDLGASLAGQFIKTIAPTDRQLSSLAVLSTFKLDRSKLFASQTASKAFFAGEAAGTRLASRPDAEMDKLAPGPASARDALALKTMMHDTLEKIQAKISHVTVHDLKRILFRCAAMLISLDKCDHELVHLMVAVPYEVFSPSAISAGIEAWAWAISEKPELEVALLGEVVSAWSRTIAQEKGIFSTTLNYEDPFYHSIGYSPTDRQAIEATALGARRMLSPHSLIMQMLLSRLQAARYRKPGLMLLLQGLVMQSARAHGGLSTHPLAREARFSFLLFGFETLRCSHLDSYCEHALRDAIYEAAFSWFAVRPQRSYGANRTQIDVDVKLLSEFLSYLQTDTIRGQFLISSLVDGSPSSRMPQYFNKVKDYNQLLRLLVEDEIYRLCVWANPTNDAKRGADIVGTTERGMVDSKWIALVRTAWQIDPAIAYHLAERFMHHPVVQTEVGRLIRSNTKEVLDTAEATRFVLGDKQAFGVQRDLKYLLVWAAVPPVIAIECFQNRNKSDPLVLQYAHRVLEQHPVDLTFFFVPQIVQALRHDQWGYVSRFILETAKISSLFCHQIIWNMKANCYKDDLGELEDSMKPQLDDLTNLVVASLSGEAKLFYEREFAFFGEVTSISGKLRPFVKKDRSEKKAKIDEEMAKIQVEVGVYLPSNPDGKVIDIDRKSGRPLQSHAKTPFMATFKVRKERFETIKDLDSETDQVGEVKRVEFDTWLRAIFKVGDDCRQDVLALQVIAMFKNIFTEVGLTLYLFPYRVTATAPGCGVIDVVPNATSRDEMGRAKVNDLLGFFVAKYGGEDTIAFQRARLNFIQSMAAYSVACYILQIKDRHNGNIMIDGEGHIVHIDFGFLFDIGPGGVKFEPSSFKLTHEMVNLMGGRYSQGYQLFQHLTVKAFLALRPYTDQLVSTVQLMLDTGLPSFKGEPTIKRLRDRFAPGVNERQAAEWMMGVVRNAHENVRSTVYDEFQRLQNGIPYA